jgi:Tol biopolymer transport system component/DNA-binding winged helix-turn-helix (wHTH) protein
MVSPVPESGCYRFGPFRLDPHSRLLDREGTVLPLAPRTFDLLHAFVRSGGRLLTKNELLRQVWGDVNVEEASLAFQVSTLRKALGEQGTAWIETVPKHGYRFTAPVREVRPEDPRDREALSTPPAARVRLVPAMWRWAAGLVAVVAVVVAFWYASRPDAPVPAEIRLEAVPLTSYIGLEAEPTFSPDGSQVAFTWDGENQDNHDIYVKAIGAEQPLRLTSDRARDGSPAWSPDGTRIAFLRDKPGGGSEVRLIASTGGADHMIGEVQGLADQGLSWHPDGRSLAVVDRSSPGERNGILALNIVTGSKTKLTSPSTHDMQHDMQPAFSPDGRTLAFTRQLRSPEFGAFVHVVPVAGGEPKVLVPTSVGPRRGRLAWVAGGREILFPARLLAQDGGPPRPSSFGRASSLWSVPVEAGQARPLGGTERAVDVAVSQDGHRLVYSQGTMDWDIWQLDLRRGRATGEAQTRFAPSTEDDANPQFSPDGERVAFTSVRSGQNEIWVVDGQGRHPLKLTSLGRDGDAACPRWSPDGKWIAFDFTARGGNNVDIYVISAAGGTPKRLTTSPAIDSLASWSKDGRFIYFGSNRNSSWQVWKVPWGGEEPGNARQVTRGGGFAAIESTNGRHVYFTKRPSGTPDPRNALWRIPVEGGDEEVVIEGFRSSHGNWDLTANGVYFVDEEHSSSGTSWVVRFQGFGRRHATEVARLRHPPFLGGPAISVSSDGRWMLSTQRQEESDLMLAEISR